MNSGFVFEVERDGEKVFIDLCDLTHEELEAALKEMPFQAVVFLVKCLTATIKTNGEVDVEELEKLFQSFLEGQDDISMDIIGDLPTFNDSDDSSEYQPPCVTCDSKSCSLSPVYDPTYDPDSQE